jgi:hypothetical protein
MTQSTLWIGTTSKFVSAPLPDLPLEARLSGYGADAQLESGLLAGIQGFAQAKQYDFIFTLADSRELALYRRLRQGSFGTGLIYFPDPMAQRVNLFPPHWAEPGLIETTDWPSTADTDPTYSNVSTNVYDQPLRKSTFNVTATANTAPTKATSSIILPIPPDQTLWLGVSGAVTGTAVQRVVAHNIAAGSSTGSSLTLLTDTASTRLNASFAGSSYDYVEVFGEWRTTSASSTLVVTSRIAQLWPTGTTPTLTGNHMAGEGNTGCIFVGPQWTDTYRIASDDGTRLYRDAAYSLIEVGATR